jgi:hypothetical protein
VRRVQYLSRSVRISFLRLFGSHIILRRIFCNVDYLFFLYCKDLERLNIIATSHSYPERHSDFHRAHSRCNCLFLIYHRVRITDPIEEEIDIDTIYACNRLKVCRVPHNYLSQHDTLLNHVMLTFLMLKLFFLNTRQV